jgi:dihydroorotate dehydrogenase (fumarate)
MDTRTTYLGIELKHPIVPSASPLSRSTATIQRLEENGAAGVVMHSLFEEQITLESEQLDHYLSYFTDAFAEALSWYPEQKDYNVGPEEYLENIRRAKEAVEIPIIGSLNGISAGGWIGYAEEIEQAGADALELNVYYIPTDPSLTGGDVEQLVVDVLRAVKETISIPVAVKLSPYFSSIPQLARRLVDAGADGLALFNRFYQPDLDLETFDVVPSLVLSTSDELRLPLRWVAILYGQVSTDLAITTGVHTYVDVLKGLMAGAQVTMMASELLQNGVERIQPVLDGMVAWMEEQGYESVAQMRGSMSQQNVADPAAFERANYMKVLQSWRPDPAGQLYRELRREL